MSRKIAIIITTMVLLLMSSFSVSAAEIESPYDNICEMNEINHDDSLKHVVQYMVLDSTDSDDNYEISVHYAYVLAEDEGIDVDCTDKKDIEKAFSSLDSKTIPEILLDSESYSHGDHSNLLDWTTVKNKSGQYYLKLKYEGIPRDIYAMPITSSFWRVINIYPDGSYEDFALNYEDTDEQRSSILNEITSYLEEESFSEETPAWTFIVIIALVAIAVITGFLINRKKRRFYRAVMENPEKNMERVPKPGDILITLKCLSCGKDYSIYVAPKDEKYIRKNRDRCPECRAAERARMEDISGRTWYIR